MNRALQAALALLACAAMAGASAETAPLTPPAPENTSPPPGLPMSPAHWAAALELARALQLEQYMETTIEGMAPPGMRREILRRVLMQRLDVKAFESFAARVYGETFTEAELRQLTAFYQTELGRKLQARLPGLQKNVTRAIAASPAMMANFFVSGCAAAAVAGAAEQSRQFQTTVGQAPPTVEDVMRNVGPLMAKAEASCHCMFEKAMATAKNKDPSQMFSDPSVKAAVDEAMRSGACPRPM